MSQKKKGALFVDFFTLCSLSETSYYTIKISNIQEKLDTPNWIVPQNGKIYKLAFHLLFAC